MVILHQKTKENETNSKNGLHNHKTHLQRPTNHPARNHLPQKLHRLPRYRIPPTKLPRRHAQSHANKLELTK